MASVVSATVSNSITGTQLTFTDTGTYTAPVTSRVLNFLDSDGNIIATYNMGSSLTQNIPITSDGYYTFKLQITDATGVLPLYTLNYLAIGIYTAAFLNAMSIFGCGCGNNQIFNLFKGELNLVAAEDFALVGLGVSAETSIIAANIYVNAAYNTN